MISKTTIYKVNIYKSKVDEDFLDDELDPDLDDFYSEDNE